MSVTDSVESARARKLYIKTNESNDDQSSTFPSSPRRDIPPKPMRQSPGFSSANRLREENTVYHHFCNSVDKISPLVRFSNMLYSLRPIILFAKVDIFRHILVVDTYILAKSNMGRREY
jgi:hypothetical protein